jgi:hypothetical protein
MNADQTNETKCGANGSSSEGFASVLLLDGLFSDESDGESV